MNASQALRWACSALNSCSNPSSADLPVKSAKRTTGPDQVGDATDQQIAAQPGGRRHSIQPPPFDPQIGGGQRVESNDPGFDIGRIGVTTDRGPRSVKARRFPGEPSWIGEPDSCACLGD